MNKQIKKEWCSALRSGKYKQCTGALKEKDGDEGVGYCCLGVLTSLYGKKTKKRTDLGNDTYSFLTDKVAKWAGIDTSKCYESYDYEYDPKVKVGKKNRRLSSLNDKGTSFKEIADLIEESL